MMRHSFQPWDWTFVKDYGILFFTRNKVKNISKNVNGKRNQKLLDHAQQSVMESLKTTLTSVIKKKKAEPTGDFIGNKIVDRTIWLFLITTK